MILNPTKNMFHSEKINETLDDADLFLFIQEGNKQAFTVVYQRYHKMLYILAYKYLKDQSMAEDAVQHVYIKLWENHKDLQVNISLRNYLYTMTRNYVINQIRNYNNSIAHNYAIYQAESKYEDNLLETIEKKELFDAFYQAIELLPEQKKMVCRMKMEEKLSNQDIADRMNISINTVKTHYAQAIKILRADLRKFILILFCIILY